MQRTIKETDTFQLLIKENIDNLDYQYLFMLYQPIIGVNATNLYLTLIQEKHLTDRINLDFNHTRLMLLLNFDQEELLNAIKALETFKLLISYYHPSKSSYIYQIKKPLSAAEFFTNEKLKTNLINKIGSLQFERQKYYFSKHQPEITEDFVLISDLNENHYDQEVRVSNVNLQELMTKLNKTQKELQTFKPIVKAPSHQLLRSNLETQTTINVNQVDNKAVLNQTLSSMQEKSPEDYLFTLTTKPIDDKLKSTLKILSSSYQLNNEVVNCLLEYVWFKNNQRIEPNYILKIAKTLYEKKIDDVSSALSYLKLAYQKSQKNTYGKQKKYHQEVLWTNENYDFEWQKPKEVSKEEDNLMSKKEITEILEEFDKY